MILGFVDFMETGGVSERERGGGGGGEGEGERE